MCKGTQLLFWVCTSAFCVTLQDHGKVNECHLEPQGRVLMCYTECPQEFKYCLNGMEFFKEGVRMTNSLRRNLFVK